MSHWAVQPNRSKIRIKAIPNLWGLGFWSTAEYLDSSVILVIRKSALIIFKLVVLGSALLSRECHVIYILSQ
jgi:hypothetical protein